MSELEVRRARMEVEKSAAEFEVALDRLREQVEGGIEIARELGDKVREPSELIDEFMDSTVQYAKESAQKLFNELRVAAEEEFHKLDKHPLVPCATTLVTGLVLGFFLGRAPRGSQKRGQQAAF